MMTQKTSTGKFGLTSGMLGELDALIKDRKKARRWSADACALLAHYRNTTDASVGTLCKVMEKAYPDRVWPYAIVNSKLQYMATKEIV